MRLRASRIEPLADHQFNAEQIKVLGGAASEAIHRAAPAGGRVGGGDEAGQPLLNVIRTMVQVPAAYNWLGQFAAYVLANGDGLALREREIVILRTGFLCRSGYEWTLHSLLAQRAGALTVDEIVRIKAGSEAGWSPPDAVLIRATDELYEDRFITDPTWAALRAHFSENQCMDVVFSAGQYNLVSMALNTFGVQLDEGLTPDPDLEAF